jgi:hypothetical protein
MTGRVAIVAAMLIAGWSAEATAADDASTELPRPEATTKALDTRHRHEGFYIRPDLGFGYLRASGSPGGVDASIGGAGATFGIAVGGTVSENSVLAFHLWDMVVSNPSYSIGGTTVENIDATLTLLAFGPQYTHYTPDNLYFSLTPSLTRATLTSQGSTEDSNWGFGMRAAIGKEWWVADRWGLGVAGHLSLTVNKAPADAGTWTGWGASIAFSATYN